MAARKVLSFNEGIDLLNSIGLNIPTSRVYKVSIIMEVEEACRVETFSFLEGDETPKLIKKQYYLCEK